MSFIKEIARGILIGIANIIPGVSGGTMMVSMGIYDKLIGSITNLFRQFKKSILTLFPYAIGMVLGIIGFGFVIEYLFEKFPLQTAMLFVGMILGGVPVISKKVRGKKPETLGIILLILFFALIIGLQLMDVSDIKDSSIDINFANILKLFLVGIIASATMIIPGVSGSMMMMALGYYYTILESVTGFVKMVLAFDISGIFHYVWILLPFGIGVLIGIFAVAKLIEFLLARFERLTYFAILGLVCGSPFAVLLGIGVSSITFMSVLASAVVFTAGFILAYSLAKE